MNGPGTGNRARWRLLLVGAAVLAGCAEEDAPQQDVPTVRDVAMQRQIVRRLTEAELDTLRAMKERHQITRDQYWDDRGGVLENDWVELWYAPGEVTVTHGMYTVDAIAAARRTLVETFGRLPDAKVKVVCSTDLESYQKDTGNDWWLYSKVDGDEITFQPIPMLVQRTLAPMAIKREYFKWAIDHYAGGRAPRWVVEGYASVLGDEKGILTGQLLEFPDDPVKMDAEAVEKSLRRRKDRKETRMAFYNAYRMVSRLLSFADPERLPEAILAMKERGGEAALADAYGRPYDELRKDATMWTFTRPEPSGQPAETGKTGDHDHSGHDHDP